MSRAIRQRRLRERRATRRRAQLVLFAVVALTFAGAVTAYGTFDYLKGNDKQWPTIDNLRPERIGQNSLILSSDGKKMGYIQSDQNRHTLPFKSMGTWAPKATVAIEDKRFYQHNGVDPEGILRAFTVNLKSHDNAQGASTITQQVIRNLYKEITAEKTLSRKAKEATLAIQLEKKWDKQRILQTYLNLVFYGNNAYGIDAAAQTYFNTSAAKLTIAQAALLAGLPQSPTTYDPFDNPTAAIKRRGEVLDAMRAQGMITKAQHDTAMATKLKLTAGQAYKVKKLPYFFDYVQQDLIKQFGSETVRQGGLRVKTTIDPRMQKLAESALKQTLNGPSGAIAVLDTKTGDIRAMASTESYSKSKFNRPAQARRQPGSTAKTWVLAAFMREGVNPDTTIYTSQAFGVKYKGAPDSAWWRPKTFEGTYAGPGSIRTATLRSDNSVFAQMTLDVGPEKVEQAAHDIGISSPLQPVWSIGLGSMEVTPLEQTNFYSSIARGGVRIDPRAIETVTTPGGTHLPLKYPSPKRVLKDWQAQTIVSILHDNVRGGTGVNANIPGRDDIAGKTGTTDDAKDAWFCGMTPELTACVWMGYNTPVAMPGVQGGGPPAMIWRRFMEPALNLRGVQNRDWFKVTGEPTWVPGWKVDAFKDNPSYVVTLGGAPDDKKKSDDDKDKDKADGKDAAAGDDAATPATGGATPPATGGTTAPPTDGTVAPPTGGGGAAPPTGGTATPAPATGAPTAATAQHKH